MAVPFLTAQLGPDALLAVEVAWGADLAADASTWTWTDVTTDVRVEQGVNLRHGRSDEAGVAQPAQCKVTLDNVTGRYSLGGQSPNWPYVRQNTPVRVRVDLGDGGGYHPLFLGYADSWTPAWDQSANVATVELTASGILRRLAQNTAPIVSSLRRRLTSEPNVVAYWPLEEGDNSTAGLSAFPGHPSMTVTLGEVNFAADKDSFPSTVQMPVLKNGVLAGQVRRYDDTGQCQVRALMAFPDTGLTDQARLLRVFMASSTLSQIDLLYTTGGGLKINGYKTVSGSTNQLVFSSGPWAFELDDTRARLFLELTQNGSGIDWKFGTQSVEKPSGSVVSGTLASSTLGPVNSLDLGGIGNVNGLSVGHVVVQNEVTGIFDDFGDLTAFDGEAAFVRFQRLCRENGIGYFTYGDGIAGTGREPADLMGPQRPDVLLSLLRDAEAVSGGVLLDGLDDSDGLILRIRQAFENGDVRVSIPANKLASPLQPEYDDQGRVNVMQAKREGGGTYTAEDVDGPLGTSAVGVYDASQTLALESDDPLIDRAWWEVAKGTIDGYRHPSIQLNLVATPEFAADWLEVLPGRRIQVTDVTSTVGQYPVDTIDLLVQGYQQTLTPFRWDVTVNCSPYGPWQVLTLAEDSGDTSPFLGRLDTDGATLTAAVSAGATTLSVATTSGPLWTTNADDFPLDVEVGGHVVTVSNITGSASPQTFTCSPVPRDLAAGVPVQVHQPAVLGM